MTTRSQPTVITITTAEPARRDRRPTIAYPEVQRRVAPGKTYLVHSISYPAGCVITVRADIAFALEQEGILVPTDDAA